MTNTKLSAVGKPPTVTKNRTDNTLGFPSVLSVLFFTATSIDTRIIVLPSS